MKVITGGRRSGKTSQIIRMSHEMNAYILVANKQQAKNVANTAEYMGLRIPYPITIHELKNLNNNSEIRRKGILVDESLHILELFLGTPILGASVNIEEYEGGMNDLNDAIEEIKRTLLNNKSDEVKEVYLINAIRLIEAAQLKLEECKAE